MHGRHLPLETRLKIGKAGLGKHHTEETKKLLSKARLGMKFSKEWRLNLSKSHLGHHLSEEQKHKISESNKGKVPTEEHRKHLSQALVGTHQSKETRIRHSLTLRNNPPIPSFKGRKHSEETKRKLRIATINYMKKMNILSKPVIGKNETRLLNEIEGYTGLKLMRNHEIVGYFVDGYSPELNIVVEIDEPYHYYADGTLKPSDVLRQKNIEDAIGCTFIRIRDESTSKTW